MNSCVEPRFVDDLFSVTASIQLISTNVCVCVREYCVVLVLYLIVLGFSSGFPPEMVSAPCYTATRPIWLDSFCISKIYFQGSVVFS